MNLRIIHTDGGTSELAIACWPVRLGRDPACEIAFDRNIYRTVSREHARIERTAAGLILVHRSGRNKTLLNNQPVEDSAALKVGDRIRLGPSGPTVEILSVEAPRPKPMPAIKPATPLEPTQPDQSLQEYGATVQAGSQHFNLLRGTMAADRFEVGSGGVIGREKGTVEFLNEVSLHPKPIQPSIASSATKAENKHHPLEAREKHAHAPAMPALPRPD
jgi:hypothetical protein